MINEQSQLLPKSVPENEPTQEELPEDEEDPVDSRRLLQCILDVYSDNKFVIHVAVAIGLANVYPAIGAVYLCPSITANWIAVIFIFTMAGLSLKSQELRKAMTRMRFNLFVQAFNFGIISMLVFGVTRGLLYLNLLSEGLASGMVICACMPITVTMVIVLTKSANGDEASAILNAALGSLLGVFVSPLLILYYIGVRADIDLVNVFAKLCLRVLVPIALGQVLQQTSPSTVEFVRVNKKYFKTCQEWALVFIVYTAFCKSFSSSQSIDARWSSIVVMAISQVACLSFSMWLAWNALKIWYREEPRLRVMGLYGCTEKSVAMGIPLLNAIYEHDPNLGLYTLPLLVWHPAQLMIGSSLAPKLAEGVEQLETYSNLSSSGRRSRQRVSFFERPRPMKRESFVAFEADE